MAEEPFVSQGILFGVNGIDLKRALDVIPPTRLARMTNVTRKQEGELQGRQGIQPIIAAPAGVEMHSIIRVSDYNSGSATFTHQLVICVDGRIFWGDETTLTEVTVFPFTDRSGLPATFVNAIFFDSSDVSATWTLISDGVNGSMYKVRQTDGRIRPFSVYPSSLVFPNNYCSAALGTQLKVLIDDCETAGWTNNAGTGAAPANATDNVNFKVGTKSLKLTTASGGAAAYYNFWNLAVALNLGTNAYGAVSAADDDIIHLWLRTDRPDEITEFRFYFCVNGAFDLNTVPGTDVTKNTDAYYKAFRPSDFTSIYEVTSATTPGASSANATLTTLGQLPEIVDGRVVVQDIINQRDPSIRGSVEMAGGRGSWQELGIIGIPLRRGDFSRIGTAPLDWTTVTGLVCVAQISANAAVNIWLDDIYLTGGADTDTSAVGATAYDYRATNISFETGEESNPSPVMGVIGTPQPINTLRQAIVVTPPATGGAGTNNFQRIYRRGGTLPDNWRFVGDNASDGATFTDTFSDLSISGSKTLDIDNDGIDGPYPAIWGPVNGIVFACGNTAALGTLRWSKVDKPTTFPALYTFDVCSPSEELMNGFVVSGQSFCISRENLYINTPDLSNSAIMNVQPTQCRKGLCARFAFVVYQSSLFFVAKDGFYVTVGPGGAEKNIGDDRINSLFLGQTKYGYQPIDWTAPDSIRCEVHESEVWFKFKGVGSLAVGSVTGIIGDGTGPASGHAGANGFAILCDDNSSNFLGPVQANGSGLWTITNVPVGTYTLVVYDSLDQAYRRAAGAITVTAGNLTNDGTRALNTLGTHPACTGVGPPPVPGDTQVWIYNTLYDFWRHHLYAEKPSVFYSEQGADISNASRLLVGGALNATLGAIPSITNYTQDFSTQQADSHIRTGAMDQGMPRVSKLYGDAYIDVDDMGNGTVTVTPYVNNEEQALTPTTIAPAAPGRQRFYIPIDEILARNISLDISWQQIGGPDAIPPIIYQGGVSYTPQPDTSETRVTNWDSQGRLNDKWIKGILFEVDTGGKAKSVNILADGAVKQNIIVQASGRQVLQFSFTQFRGRILRLAPTDTVDWILYQHRWIFDEEPLSLLRWESQEVDHGFHGQQVPLFAHISVRSTAPVNLNMLAYRQDGTSVSEDYTLPSTGGAKTKLFVPFKATRGVLFKYTFTGAQPFWLYREESIVRIQPWGQAQPILTVSFGDDDLDVPTRGMMDAGLSSARSGAGNR